MALSDLTIPNARCYVRSIRSNEGAYYQIGVDASDGTKLIAIKSTDPGVTDWIAQDIANAPATDNFVILALHYDVRDNQILVVYQRARQSGVDTLETVLFARFDMSTDTWSEPVVVKSPDSLGQPSCQIIIQYDYIVVVYGDTWESVGGAKARVGFSYSVDLGANWTDGGYISGGGGAYNEYCARGLTGDEGGMHFAWINDDGGVFNVMQRTLSKTKVLQTVRDTALNASANYALGWPDYIGRTMAQVCMFPYNSDAGTLNCLRFDSAADPSIFNSDTISATPAYQAAGVSCAAVALYYDGLVMRGVSVQSTDRDIRQHADMGANTWSLNLLAAAGTFDMVALSVYDHNGPKVALTYSASGVEGFSELNVADTFNQLSDAQVGWNATFHGPFYIGGSLYTIMRNLQFSRVVALKANSESPSDDDWSEAGTQLHLVTNDRARQDFVPTAAAANNVNGIRGMWCVQVGTDIEVFCSQEPGNLTRSVLDTTTDEWTTRMEHIASGWDDDFGAVSFGVVKAGYDATNGHRVCAANYHETAGYAQGPWRVRLFRKASGGSWVNLGAGDGSVAATDYWIGDLIGPDSSGGFTLTYKDSSNGVLYGKYIDAAGTINDPFEIDSDIDAAHLICGRGVINDDTVYLPYVDASGRISVASWSSGSAPTVSINAGVSNNAVYRNGEIANPQPANFFGLVNQGGHPYLFYVATDQSVYYHDIDGDVEAQIISATVGQMLSVDIVNLWTFGFVYDNDDAPEFADLAVKSRAQYIFDAFNDVLTGLPTTGSNLYTSRQYAIPEDVEVAISTRIGGDLPAAGDSAYSNNVKMDRFLTLYARIHVKAGEANIDNQLLQVEREIWQALMANTSLHLPYVHQILPGGREEPEVDDLSEKPAMMCDTIWRVYYRHSLTDIGK